MPLHGKGTFWVSGRLRGIIKRMVLCVGLNGELCIAASHSETMPMATTRSGGAEYRSTNWRNKVEFQQQQQHVLPFSP